MALFILGIWRNSSFSIYVSVYIIKFVNNIKSSCTLFPFIDKLINPFVKYYSCLKHMNDIGNRL